MNKTREIICPKENMVLLKICKPEVQIEQILLVRKHVIQHSRFLYYFRQQISDNADCLLVNNNFDVNCTSLTCDNMTEPFQKPGASENLLFSAI